MSATGRDAANDAQLTRGVAVPRPLWLAFMAGAAVGPLGGLVGLGGTKFRLPLLLAFSIVALLLLSTVKVWRHA